MVEKAYSTELASNKLVLKQVSSLQIIERVAEAFKQLGIPEFNKGRVAKRIMSDLAKKTSSELPEATINNFAKVFGELNNIIEFWRKK